MVIKQGILVVVIQRGSAVFCEAALVSQNALKNTARDRTIVAGIYRFGEDAGH